MTSYGEEFLCVSLSCDPKESEQLDETSYEWSTLEWNMVKSLKQAFVISGKKKMPLNIVNHADVKTQIF